MEGPSKAMIHQVRQNRPSPQTEPQVIANALTFSLMLFSSWAKLEPGASHAHP